MCRQDGGACQIPLLGAPPRPRGNLRHTALVADIDGVLADPSHRLHHIERDDPDWDSFIRGCADDTPLQYWIDFIQRYRIAHDAHLILYSGRPEWSRALTVNWLTTYELPFDWLLLRPNLDYSPAAVLKIAWLRAILTFYQLELVIDDDISVIEAAKNASDIPEEVRLLHIHTTYTSRSLYDHQSQGHF